MAGRYRDPRITRQEGAGAPEAPAPPEAPAGAVREPRPTLIGYSIIVVAVVVSVIGVVLWLSAQPKPYINTILGISLYPPSGWQTTGNESEGLLIFSPSESNMTISFTIWAQKSDSINATFDELIATRKQQLFELLNYSLLAEGKRKIDDLDAYEMVFEYVLGERERTRTVKAKTVMVLSGGFTYTITFVALQDYESYLPVFENSLMTFKIIAIPSIPLHNSSTPVGKICSYK